MWTVALLVMLGVAFGYLLGQATAGDSGSIDPRAADAAATEDDGFVRSPGPRLGEDVTFPGTILASVRFGRGLVTWPGDRGPTTLDLASDVRTAAYDAAQRLVAVTVPELGTDALALHVGTPGDLQFVASGVTGFAWHDSEAGAIAWVGEADAGFTLMTARVSDGVVERTLVGARSERVRAVAWGSWGYALQGDEGLTTVAPGGETIAHDDVQFVAAGDDGRLIVARPAGIPLSSDWVITDSSLEDQRPLGRFRDLEEHPTAAAILPGSGRVVLVSNRFGEGSDLARIEILAADGSPEAVIRSGMIADSIAWSGDGSQLAVGGYYYGSNQIQSVVLLAASDGTGEPIEVPFDQQVRPLGMLN